MRLSKFRHASLSHSISSMKICFHFEFTLTPSPSYRSQTLSLKTWTCHNSITIMSRLRALSQKAYFRSEFAITSSPSRCPWALSSKTCFPSEFVITPIPSHIPQTLSWKTYFHSTFAITPSQSRLHRTISSKTYFSLWIRHNSITILPPLKLFL